jgi:hypothetical protein
MVHPSLLINHQKAKSVSKTRSLVNAAYYPKHIKLESIDNPKPKPSKAVSSRGPSTEVRSSATLAKIPDSSFDAVAFSAELATIADEGTHNLSSRLAGPFSILTAFVGSLKSDSEVGDGKPQSICYILIVTLSYSVVLIVWRAVETKSDVEGAVMQISGFLDTLFLSKSPADMDVLAVVRLNLRLLLAMLRRSVGGGLFDIGLLSMLLKQCTHILVHVCTTNCTTSDDGSGGKELHFREHKVSAGSVPVTAHNEDLYEDLEDGDIEYEDADGQFTTQKYNPTASVAASTTALPNETALENNCDLTGAQELLLPLLGVVWEALLYQVTAPAGDEEDAETTQKTVDALFVAAFYIATTLSMLSTDTTDCRRLSHSGALTALQRGLELYANGAMFGYIVSADANTSTVENSTGCLVVLLSVLREFSMRLKDQVLDGKYRVTALLCELLKLYRQHPQVVVNCSRVLAKLSVSSEGRAQINATKQYVASLVSAVVHEHSKVSSLSCPDRLAISALN